MSTLLFVHGACVRDAPWWWSRMIEPLAGHGIASVAVPLPSCGETEGALGDLDADVDAVRSAIIVAEAPVVLSGHSYGGMVITEAGADRRVAQLIYVTSMMPRAGQSVVDVVGSEPTPWMNPGDDGTTGVHAKVFRELFVQDCDEATAQGAVDRLTRQSLTPFVQPARHVCWKDRPSTFFVCTEDLAIPAELQRQRAGVGARLVDFPSGHHPFLSQPRAFADAIAGEIASVVLS